MLLIGNVNGSYFLLKFISQLVYLLSLDLLENNLTRKQIIIDQVQIILYGSEIIIKYKLSTLSTTISAQQLFMLCISAAPPHLV